jgi:hypothetical protein
MHRIIIIKWHKYANEIIEFSIVIYFEYDKPEVQGLGADKKSLKNPRTIVLKRI